MPVQWRAAVVFAQEHLGLSQRRACRLVGCARATVRYRSRRGEDDAGRTTRSTVGSGSQGRNVLASATGACMSCSDRKASSSPTSGLRDSLARKVWRCASGHARARPASDAATLQRPRVNEQWALDFRQGAVASGRPVRLLSVIDVSTREALVLEGDTSLAGSRVVRVLDRLCGERPAPAQIVLDNGPELISRVLEQWAH